MNTEDYFRALRGYLQEGRMAPHDVEEAVLRCGQYIIDAGPEHEAEAMAELGTPAELAQNIMTDYRMRLSERGRSSGLGLSLGMKILLGIVLFPLIIAIYLVVFAFVIAGIGCVIAGLFYGLVGFSALLPGSLGTCLNFAGGGLIVAGVGFLLAFGGIMLTKPCNLGMRALFGGRRGAV